MYASKNTAEPFSEFQYNVSQTVLRIKNKIQLRKFSAATNNGYFEHRNKTKIKRRKTGQFTFPYTPPHGGDYMGALHTVETSITATSLYNGNDFLGGVTLWSDALFFEAKTAFWLSGVSITPLHLPITVTSLQRPINSFQEFKFNSWIGVNLNPYSGATLFGAIIILKRSYLFYLDLQYWLLPTTYARKLVY